MNENQKSDFAELIARVLEGSEEAIGLLMEYYEERLHRVIRRRLNVRMRSQYDTADFAQIVWKSFFTNIDRVTKCQSAGELEGFLAAMARNKVIDACRRAMGQRKRDALRERRIDQGDSVVAIQLLSADATPSHIVSVREEWDRLLLTLPERHRRMIVLRAQGCTFKEIADEVGMNERTIRRVFQSIQERNPDVSLN